MQIILDKKDPILMKDNTIFRGDNTKDILDILKVKTLGYLVLREKNGMFLGDPCNEDSKRILLTYTFQGDHSAVQLTQTRFSLPIHHFFNGNYFHRVGTYDIAVNLPTLLSSSPMATHTFPVEAFSFEHSSPLPAGIHTFKTDRLYAGEDEAFRKITSEDDYGTVFYANYHSDQFISIDVIVPQCLNEQPSDSAVGDSAVDDSEDYVVLDNYSDQSLVGILDKIKDDSKKLSSVIDNGKKITSKLQDSTDDDSLPGLDYDLTEDELTKFENTGSSSIGLLIESEEYTSDCKDKIKINVYIGNNDLVNRNIGWPIDVTLIENGPRGTITHVVQTWVGEGQLTINNPPPGYYLFDVKSAILQDDSKADIFSGEYISTSTPRTVNVVACSDSSDNTDSSVTSDSQCTDDYAKYGEIKVVDRWGSYDKEDSYYFFNVGWSFEHSNPYFKNNVNSMTVDVDITGPFDNGPPTKTVRTDYNGKIRIGWPIENFGTYTFKIVNFQNMGSYCGNGDTITLTIP